MSNADEEVEILTRRNFLAQTVAVSCACAAACVFAAGDAFAETKPPAKSPTKPGSKPGGNAGQGEGTAVPGKTTVGPLAAFAKQPDGIYDKFAKAPTAFLIVINDGKVYALSSVCTHKKKLVHTYEKDKKQAICPAHSSVFDLDGTPTTVTPDGDKTPARDPLPRHGITVTPKGILIVDTTKTFTFDQKDMEGAFVEIPKKGSTTTEKPEKPGTAKKTAEK